MKIYNLDEDKMIEMMVGRKLTEQFPRVEVNTGKIILKVENLNNEYVNNINFEVKSRRNSRYSRAYGSWKN